VTVTPPDVHLTDRYDVALVDLDGVVYRGLEPIPGVARAVAGLDGLRLSYVTNNATRTPEQVWQQLAMIGCPGSAADVVTSCQAAAALLLTLVPAGSRILAVGAPALAEALIAEGFACVYRLDDNPVAVAQGLALDLTYDTLTEAALAIRSGLPWVATNMDATLPTARGLQPGNGAFVSALRTATGREPVAAGKPQPALFRTAVAATGARRPLVVGDRLDTDIAGAHNAGLDSLLVLSGVSTAADALGVPPVERPTYVGADIGALVDPHPLVVRDGSSASCGGWTVTLAPVVLSGAGEPLDALRALLAVPRAVRDVRGSDPGAVRALAALGLLEADTTV
jgi:HAD superfamily hydrolase (TIGR01450 family)